MISITSIELWEKAAPELMVELGRRVFYYYFALVQAQYLPEEDILVLQLAHKYAVEGAAARLSPVVARKFREILGREIGVRFQEKPAPGKKGENRE